MGITATNHIQIEQNSESVLIGNNIKITVEKISKSKVNIRIEAPKKVVLFREEV